MTITTEQLKERAEYWREKTASGETSIHQLIALQYAEVFEELAEARELLTAREAVPVVEPDYIRRDCGCCGFESLNYFQDDAACPKCNHKPLGKTALFTSPPAPAVPREIPLTSPIAAEYVAGWNACRAAMLAAAPNHFEHILDMVSDDSSREVKP